MLYPTTYLVVVCHLDFSTFLIFSKSCVKLDYSIWKYWTYEIYPLYITKYLSTFAMASNPPGECCAREHPREGSPKGEFKDFHGLETYFSYPPNRKDTYKCKIILFFADVNGIKTNGAVNWADRFAAQGYFVILPDIYRGEALPPLDQRPHDFSLYKWLEAHGPEVIQSAVDQAYNGIMKEFKPQKLGAVGICYGAKFAIRALKDQVAVAFVAHPSFVTSDELSAITGPISIAAAESDDIFTKELRHQSEDVLTNITANYQLSLYSHTKHGFAVRGSSKDRVVQFQSESAFAQAVRWFTEYL
ncbi:dienelactone hydrolase family protein [Tirmania nivea]|nr:dienelactone hydrolase family protein [Tirmania nivea]